MGGLAPGAPEVLVLSAAPLCPGDTAPVFSLPNQYAETVHLGALRGAPVVVMFYPFAFSRVCGGELAELGARWEEFAATGAQVLAVSCDAVHALRAYADQLGGQESPGVPFDLLSDFWPHGAVAESYGAFNQDRGCPRRSTFVLDTDLNVTHIISSAETVARSADAVLEAVRSV